MSNPFLIADNPNAPWKGKGRKIHCKTVFLRRVLELVKGEGIEAIITGGMLVCYETIAGMKIGVVFDVQGHVTYPVWPASLPEFRCDQLVMERSKQKTSDTLTRGNTHATANVILHKMGK